MERGGKAGDAPFASVELAGEAHQVKRAHVIQPPKERAMCAEKDVAKTKIDRLIEAMDRLTFAVTERLSIPTEARERRGGGLEVRAVETK